MYITGGKFHRKKSRKGTVSKKNIIKDISTNLRCKKTSHILRLVWICHPSYHHYELYRTLMGICTSDWMCVCVHVRKGMCLLCASGKLITKPSQRARWIM